MKRLDANWFLQRREFLRDGTRLIALGGLAAVGAVLAGRWPGGLSPSRCFRQGVCGGCAAFGDCGLPQALSARSEEAKHLQP